MPPFNESRNTAQNASQAIRELEELSLQVTALREDLVHANLVLQGLWELLKEKHGMSEDDLSSMVTELAERLEKTPREAEKCPSCNRALQNRSKACIYCGTLVKHRRLF